MIYVFDLDGTLCTSEGGVYGDARPIRSRVERVRDLYRAGHTIVISTARGAMWESYTKDQLFVWDIPYHVLSVGAKPYGDFYIDDKAVRADEFFGREA